MIIAVAILAYLLVGLLFLFLYSRDEVGVGGNTDVWEAFFVWLIWPVGLPCYAVALGYRSRRPK